MDLVIGSSVLKLSQQPRGKRHSVAITFRGHNNAPYMSLVVVGLYCEQGISRSDCTPWSRSSPGCTVPNIGLPCRVVHKLHNVTGNYLFYAYRSNCYFRYLANKWGNYYSDFRPLLSTDSDNNLYLSVLDRWLVAGRTIFVFVCQISHERTSCY